MITLPKHLWFVQEQDDRWLTNIYTGSLGTDPQKGCFPRRTFNFKVFVQIGEEGPVCLSVSYYWRTPWNEGAQVEDPGEATFENSQEGLDAAAAWLLEQYEKGNE